MLKIKLNKTTKPSGKKVYTATVDGKEVYKSSPTNRDYVAIAIGDQGDAWYRFGRVDLIGKGDSRAVIENCRAPYLAVLDEVKNQVQLPGLKEPVNRSAAGLNGPTGHGDMCYSDADPGL